MVGTVLEGNESYTFTMIILTYNALRIVSTGIIYRLSNGREWVELAENARFFSMKDQEEF